MIESPDSGYVKPSTTPYWTKRGYSVGPHETAVHGSESGRVAGLERSIAITRYISLLGGVC